MATASIVVTPTVRRLCHTHSKGPKPDSLALKQVMGRLPDWLNAVASKQNYLSRLQVAIERLHGCGANWRESVPVHEVSLGQTVWSGEVEVFDLYGHDQATVCYGWSHSRGKNDKGERFVTILQIPPVISPESAVKVSIEAEAKPGGQK